MPFPRRRLRVFSALSAAAALAAVALPSGASAGVLTVSASCGNTSLSTPFSPWLDPSQYGLNGGGDFEQQAKGWSLYGASVTDGNEPWQVTGSSNDRSSLKLPAGSSAVSSVSCVGLQEPTLRFFAKRSSNGLFNSLSSLQVSALTETSLGAVVSTPVGVVLNDGTWQPTPVFAIVANLLPLLPGDQTPVAFVFTPVGTASWQIDDLYVDPWGRG